MTAIVPNEVHRRRGTTGANHRVKAAPTAAPKTPLPPDIGLPPRSLGKEGKAVWSRMRKERVSWLAGPDLLLLQMTCEMVDQHARLAERAATVQTIPTGMTPAESRLLRAMGELQARITVNLSKLGLSPTDRARLNVSEPPPEDEMAKYRREMGVA